MLDGLLSYATTDTHNTMSKTAGHPLGEDKEMPPEASGSFETQTMQRVEPARNTMQPCCEASKQPCLGCANICDGWTKRSQNVPQPPQAENISERRDFSLY